MKKIFAMILASCLLVLTGCVRPETPTEPDVGTIQLNVQETEQFMSDMIDAVRTAAENAQFDADTATAFLSERKRAYEVTTAIDEGNVRKLNWVFAEVLTEPEPLGEDGQSVSMLVKPLSDITEIIELPKEMTIIVRSQFLTEETTVSDLILFPMVSAGDNTIRPVVDDGQPSWECNAYVVIKQNAN